MESIEATKTHHHFTISDLKGLHELLVMAPVQEIEELQDTYFDTLEFDNLKTHKRWLCRHAGICGPVHWLERKSEAKHDAVYMSILSRDEHKLKKKATHLLPVVFTFTQYTLDTSSFPDSMKIFIDVMELPDKRYAIIGTLQDFGLEQQKMVQQHLEKIMVKPVCSKILLHIACNPELKEHAGDILHVLAYQNPATFEKDPL